MALSTIAKVGVATASIVAIGTVANAGNAPTTPPQTTDTNTTTTVKAAVTPTTEHKTVTTTEPVAFQTSSVQDGNLALGTTVTRSEGVSGVRTYTFDVTYTNGVETARTEVSSEITTPAVDRVIANGTYVEPVEPTCPNGTYVNSVGNTVCSPYSSPSTPAGATAVCGDGTYSFSQSRRGACSYHGGVAQWL